MTILTHPNRCEFKYRLITAFVLIPIIITALFLLPIIWFTIITLAVCILSVWEWVQLIGLSSRNQYIWLTIFCGLMLTITLMMMPDYRLLLTIWQIKYILWIALAWWLAALLMILYYPNSAIFWRNSHSLQLIFSLLNILPFFCSMLVLRQLHYDSNHFIGAWWLLYVMLLVWGFDSGAYILGKSLGFHKMIPKISPEKTWEGLVGGLVTSAIISYLFIKYAPLNVALFELFICSILTLLASILGDLTESMFKREAGIKDSGHLIPGHGGILDRIDSLTAAVPVFVCLMLLVYNAI